jgi:hypothetical protein
MRTIGKFRQEFLQCLPELEHKMIENDLDPEDFIIAKPMNKFQTTFGGDYIITIKGQSFTVNMAGDMRFLEYFYSICFPKEENAQTHPAERKLLAVMQRLEKWLTEDPLKK